MKSLPGHDAAIGDSLLTGAFWHGRAGRKTSDCECEMRLFIGRSGRERGGSGLPASGIAKERRGCMVRMRVSPVQFRLLPGHCFGAYATPGGGLALLLCYRTLRVTVSICDGPSVNAELRPWESRPLARLRQV